MPRQAKDAAMFAQKVGAERVESRHEGSGPLVAQFWFASDNRHYPPEHFLGRLIGKSDGEDGVGTDAAFNQVENPMRDRFRFAGAGAGADKQWPVAVTDGFALCAKEIG